MSLGAAEAEIIRVADPLFRLSGKQRAFAMEYAQHGNASRAARNAGYSPKTAAMQGRQLREKPEIQEAIHALLVARALTAGITEERVTAEIALIAFDRSENVQTRDKLNALQMLSRYLGLFDDRLKISLDDPDIIEAAGKHGIDPQQLVSEMAQLAPIDTDS